MPARGGAFTFGVTIAAGCAWTARTDVDWADVSPGSGEGNGRPLLQVGDHTRLDTRTLTVVVNNRPFPITQAGAGCVYTVDTTSFDVADEGGQLSFTLNTMNGCAWTAASSVDWITLRTPSGSGGGTFFFNVASNRGGDPRQGLITIAGQRVNIAQRRG